MAELIIYDVLIVFKVCLMHQYLLNVAIKYTLTSFIFTFALKTVKCIGHTVLNHFGTRFWTLCFQFEEFQYFMQKIGVIYIESLKGIYRRNQNYAY